MFICVSAVHLGLTDAIKRVARHDLPVIGCVKCLTFWSVLAWSVLNNTGFIESLTLSFAFAYAALWLDLLMGSADTLYIKIYEYINDAQDTRSSSQASAEHETGTMP